MFGEQLCACLRLFGKGRLFQWRRSKASPFLEALKPATQKESPSIFFRLKWYPSRELRFFGAPQGTIHLVQIKMARAFQKLMHLQKELTTYDFGFGFLSRLCQRSSLYRWGKSGFLTLVSITDSVLVREKEHLLVDKDLHWFYRTWQGHCLSMSEWLVYCSRQYGILTYENPKDTELIKIFNENFFYKSKL